MNRWDNITFSDTTHITTYTYDTGGRVLSQTQTDVTNPVNPVILSKNLSQYDLYGSQTFSALDINQNGTIDFSGPDRVTENTSAYITKDNALWMESTQSVYPDFDSDRAVTTAKSRRKLTNLGNFAAVSESEDIRGNVTTKTQSVNRNTGAFISITDTPTSNHNDVTTAVYGLVRTNVTEADVVTTYEYDALNRRVEARTESDGGARVVSQITHYDRLGQVEAVEDAAGNKIWYVYDTSGRQTAVSNVLDQITIRNYDIRGNVTNVTGATYPVSYGYDEMNRLVWMKTYRDETESGDTTQWHYDLATGLLTSKVYADGKGPSYTYTPDGKLASRSWARGVTTDYGYTATGELATVDYSDGTPDVTYTYDRLGRPVTITDVQGTRTNVYDATMLSLSEEYLPDGTVFSRSTDSFGRPSGLSLGPDYSVSYDFDAYGRFSAVSSSVFTASTAASYAYVPGSRLIEGYTIDDLTRTVTYETNRDLIATVTNAWNESQISSFAYQNDAIGRRTARTDSGSVINQFGYNYRSEVTSAVMGTNVFGYAYDSIGNRLIATNNAEITIYAANALNQYSNIVNTTPITPMYDDDGNLTTNVVWVYTWDGENRLTGVSSNDVDIAAYAYDFASRRVTKIAQGVTRGYLYDGWNLIRESAGTNITHYVWGLDVSGSHQGAGGVGGLLVVAQDGNTFYPSVDANGNVTDYTDEAGMAVAHYEYSPFGESIIQSGDLAEFFAFRFSTKYWEDEAKLYYYGYRFYMPNIGRWLNRDPLGERGGVHIMDLVWPLRGDIFPEWKGISPFAVSDNLLNCYEFLSNTSINKVELWGLTAAYIKPTSGKVYCNSKCEMEPHNCETWRAAAPCCRAHENLHIQQLKKADKWCKLSTITVFKGTDREREIQCCSDGNSYASPKDLTDNPTADLNEVRSLAECPAEMISLKCCLEGMNQPGITEQAYLEFRFCAEGSLARRKFNYKCSDSNTDPKLPRRRVFH